MHSMSGLMLIGFLCIIWGLFLRHVQKDMGLRPWFADLTTLAGLVIITVDLLTP